MAKKKAADFGDVVEALAEESMAGKKLGRPSAYNKMIATMEEEDPIEEVTPGLGEDEDEHIANLASNVVEGSGWYIKIYRKFPLPDEYKGRPILVDTIDDPTLISDVEATILKKGSIAEWVDGIYSIHFLKTGEDGIKRKQQINCIFPPKPEAPIPAAAPIASAVNPFEQLKDTAMFLKDLTGQQPGAAPLNTVIDGFQKSYENGAKAAAAAEAKTPAIDWTQILGIVKEVTTPLLAPKPAPAPLPIAEILAAIAPVITALLVQKATPVVAEKSNWLEQLIAAKEAALLKPPVAVPTQQQDLIKTMALLKEMGVIQPPTPPTDPMAMIEKVVAMAGVAAPLLEKLGGGGNSSTGVELIRALVPQLGQMVGDITGSVNTAIAAKTQLLTGSAPNPALENKPMMEPGLPGEAVVTGDPSVAALVAAIESQDVSYYPQLQRLVLEGYGEDAYDQVMDGTVSVEQITQQLQALHPIFATPQAKTYFHEFVGWGRQQRASEIVAHCDACKMEFTLENKAELATGIACTECGGNLLEGETPVKASVAEQSIPIVEAEKQIESGPVVAEPEVQGETNGDPLGTV